MVVSRFGCSNLGVDFVKDGGGTGDGGRASNEVSAADWLEWFHCLLMFVLVFR